MSNKNMSLLNTIMHADKLAKYSLIFVIKNISCGLRNICDIVLFGQNVIRLSWMYDKITGLPPLICQTLNVKTYVLM